MPITPDQLEPLVDSEEFNSLSPEDRGTVLNGALREAHQWVAQNGGWTPEKFKDFGTVASGLRERATSKSVGEHIGGALKTVGNVIKDSAASMATTTASGYVPEKPGDLIGFGMPKIGSQVQEAFTTNMQKLGKSVQGTFSHDDEMLANELNVLRQDIDAGRVPDNGQGWSDWLDQRNDRLKQAQTKAYTGLEGDTPENRAFAESNSLLGNPRHGALLLDYLQTRDPAVWDELRKNVSMTPGRAKLENQQQRLAKDSNLAKLMNSAFGEGAGNYIIEAGDPLEVAGNLLPLFKGAKVVKALKAGSKLKAAGEALTGAAGETVSELGSQFMDDPTASWNQRLQVAKDAFIGALGLGGVGAGVSAIANRNQALPPPLPSSIENPASSNPPNDNLPPNQTAAAASAQFQQQALITPAPIVPGLDEHVSDLTAEDVADLEAPPVRQPVQAAPQPDSKVTPKSKNKWFVNGVAIENADDLLKNGGGVVEVSQNGRKVNYDKFGISINGNTAEVAFVELAAAERGKGIGLSAYMALGKELASRGITLQSSKAQYADGRKIWEKLAAQGLAERGGQGVYKFTFRPPVQPTPAAASQENAVQQAASLSSDAQQRSGFTNLDVTRDLEAGFMSTAGADALLDLAHRAYVAGRNFTQWAAAMVQRFGEAVRQYLAGVWDHAKRSSQTGALNFTGKLGAALQQAGQQLKPAPSGPRASLQTAYMAALQGSSTAMLPIRQVYEAAKAQNPQLTPQQFMAMVAEGDANGTVLLEPPERKETIDAAGPFVLRNASGIPSTSMMVQRGFTNLDVSGQASQRGAVQIDSGTVRQKPDGPNETQSRFASPNAADRVINGPRTNEIVAAEANAWLGSLDQQTAVETFVNNAVPLPLDAQEFAAARLIADLSEQAAKGRTEVLRLWAHVQGQRMARLWTKEFLSADPARALHQRGVVNNTILAPIAPVLAAQELLTDRATQVIDARFDGGAEGVTEKVKDVVKKADAQASAEVAADLEAETAAPETGKPASPKPKPRKGQVRAKHPALDKLLNTLRKKMYPGLKWADIFMELPSAQRERQREIYRRLKLDERLQKLTPEERLQLTNELDKAWQRERRKVFMRELEKAKIIGEKAPKDREKVKAAAPRLLRLMNLGMLNSDLFREALAKEYGLKMIDATTSAELRALGERIQQAPEGLPRRKLEQQLIERLQNLAGRTLWQTLDSYWTASVLSGWRTLVDIGLGIANGVEDVGLGSVVTALRTGNKDVALRALGALFGRAPSAIMEAVDHVFTGNKAMMRNFELEAKQAMEGGNRMASDVGAQLWRDGGWRKVPGGFMIFFGRMLTALDHVNSASTREGAKAMALARHPELYAKALRITPADRAAARQQARLELTGGAEPANHQQRLEEAARVREILDQGTPTEVLEEATEIGRRAALQGEPSGLGGFLLDGVLLAVSAVNQKANELANRENADAISRQGAKVIAAMVPLVRAISGTKFIRTVAHAANRYLSYVPGVGVVAVGQQGRTGAFGDILVARQLIGTLVGIAAYLAFDDDDDERGIEDSWRDKTPQQKAQLYAQGKQPFTVWERDSKGRVRSFNYQQWGIAGILNTVSAMLKQKGSDAGTLNVLISSLVQGGLSITDKAQLQGLQTVFGGDYRSTDPVSGIASKLNKWAAQYAGGYFPRLVKDIDMVDSPELRSSSEWWQKWAKEVPMARRLVGDKRVDIFGADIQLDRGPLSRVTQLGTADPAYRMLGRLNARDLYLPDPSTGVRVVKLSDGTRRNMNPAEKDRYQRLTGAAYKDYIIEHGARLLQMEPEKAKDEISTITKRIRDRAAYQATH